MRFDIEVTPTAQHRACARDAFADGLAAHGERTGNGPPVTWGPRQHKHYLCLEAGYLTAPEGGPYVQRRLRYLSASWDGYGGLGWIPPFQGTRFAIPARPWRKAPGYALVLGQCNGDRSVPRRYPQVLEGMLAAAAKAHGDVRYRPHPFRPLTVRGYSETGASLVEDLAGAAVAITWSSTAAVEAVLAGVPSVCLDAGAVAWPVAGHAIGEVVAPNRDAWLSELSWRNWTLAEIRSGEMWAFMKEGL